MTPHERIPFDVAKLVRRSTSGLCFICEFLKGDRAYDHVRVTETDTAIVFLNKFPTLFGYVIVAPKRHVEQVTGDFTEAEYVELQRLIFKVSEGIGQVLSPERVYILSLGSQAANAHVHWHVAPLPRGVPLERQQYFALMHEHGVIDVPHQDQLAFATALEEALRDA